MLARLISKARGAAPQTSTAVPEPGATSQGYEERYLLSTAESMLRAGCGHREIERALRRMSTGAPDDSYRLDGVRSLRRFRLPRLTVRRRPAQPGSAT